MLKLKCVFSKMCSFFKALYKGIVFVSVYIYLFFHKRYYAIRKKINRIKYTEGYEKYHVLINICISLFVVLIISLAIFGVVNMGNSDNDGTDATNTDATSADTTIEIVNEPDDPVWHDNYEKTDDITLYTPPEGVEHPYHISVNCATNCLTVYGIDNNNEYTIPVIAFQCSVGRSGCETVLGENFTITDTFEWAEMYDGTYARYAMRFSGDYLIHSVPYKSAASDTLETAEYNKLGTNASSGCVRLCVADVKWIYDNCSPGTTVTVFDDENVPDPLEYTPNIKVPEDSPYAQWDPSDTDLSNPWNNCFPKLTGVTNLVTTVGNDIDLLNGVSATDTCGNDITAVICIYGRYTFDVAGVYDITYKVTDSIGKSVTIQASLTVNE